MITPFMKAEITAAVTNLGCIEENKFVKDKYCLEALKDLIRFLRRDDDTYGVRRELGQMKLVQTNLIPIMCEYHSDDHLFDVTLRLLVNLTNPTLLLFNEELPSDKVVRNYYLQILGHLQSYKPNLSSEKLWIVLTDKLKVLLIKDPEDRMEDEKLLTERILILIRNILDIPATPDDDKRTDDDASVHDQVLWSMHLSGMEDVIIYLASSENERHFCMHIMEIISLMLREQDPVSLARTAAQRSLVEQKQDTADLVAMVQKETIEREARYKKMTASRSSIFRGTFCVKDVKSISEKDLIVHKTLTDGKPIDFNQNKKPKKKAKNRLPLPSCDATRKSTLSIRLMLKEFSLQLLNGAYNSLMHIVKDCLVRMKTQEHDETYYLWALKFFMEFNRNGKFRVELVSETVSVGLFHYIQTLVENYAEMIRIDKTKVSVWSRRLHLAVRAYQELLMTLSAMDKCGDERVVNASRVLKSNVFYVPEYREMCLVLLQNYKETQHSLAYLKDLVETNHIFLKLFEQFAKENRRLVVQKKTKATRKRKKNKKTKKSEGDETLASSSESQPPPSFDEIAGEISATLLQEPALPDDIIPFDAASDLPMDDQKLLAMGKIQKMLKEAKIHLAVALLRVCRNIWPEGEIFGALEVGPEQELLLLRELFYIDLPTVEGADVEENDDAQSGDSDGHEIEEEEMAAVKTSEQELHFDEFIRRFAHCKIVYAYCSLLRRYSTNTTLTNHCIVKMLHRIAWDCKSPGMLYQLSVFKTFQKILADPLAKTDPTVKELSKFAIFIIRKFTETSYTNPKVFVELLFWKTAREAAEVEAGYGNYQETQSSSRNVWSEEEEDELQRLHQEFKDVQDSELDLVDRIVANLINQNRNRRQVIKKMKEMGLITSTKELAKTKQSVRVRPPKEWADHELVELRRIFEEVRHSSDPLGLLIDRLPIPRAKNRIRDKIVELGLVDDVKELRKKRRAKDKSGRRQGGHSSGSGSDDDDDDARAPKEGPGSSGDGHRRRRSVDSSDDASDRDEDDDSDDDNDVFDKLKKMSDRTWNKRYGTSGSEKQEPFNRETLLLPLRQLVDSGRKEGLSWLLECLEETLEDRQDGEGAEAIPLVPLNENAIEAMEDHTFLRFIAKMGLAAPANEQEQYWRIPASFSVADLRARIDFLKETPSEKVVAEGDEEPTTAVTHSVGKRSADESGVDPIGSLKKRRRIIDSGSSDSESEAEVGKGVDGQEAEEASVGEQETLSTAASTKSRKRFAILDDSDDSD